jgi:hypothetical protein
MIGEKWEPAFREDHASKNMIGEKWEPVFREDHALNKK